jgi:hypothetical protein
MKPHLWIVPLAFVTVAGCSDDGSVVGPSTVVVRGHGRAVAPFRNGAEFIDPSQECQRLYRPIGWYPWYAPSSTCHPAK